MSVYDFDAVTLYKGLHYGPPGSYKTRLAYTATDIPGANVLGINSSGNPCSIRDYPNKPLIVNMKDLKDYNQVYAWLAAGQPKDESYLFYRLFAEHLKPPYDWIVVDQLTDTQRMSFDVALGRLENNQILLPGDVPAHPTQRTYGAVLAQMTTFARLFYNLPVNVIINALESEPSEGKYKYGPLLSGQSAQQVAAYAEVVARMMHRQRARGDSRLVERLKKELTPEEIDDIECVMMLSPSPQWDAKDQYGMGVPYLINPTMQEIMGLIDQT